jgi:hypothetical protein
MGNCDDRLGYECASLLGKEPLPDLEATLVPRDRGKSACRVSTRPGPTASNVRDRPEAAATPAGRLGFIAIRKAAVSGSVVREPMRGSLDHRLDAVNFFLADMQGGLGPFVSVFLVTAAGWTAAQVGIVLTIAGLIGICLHIPAGAVIDAARRIASPKLFLTIASLPHLICSSGLRIGSGDEAGQHGDAGRVDCSGCQSVRRQ